MPRVKRSQMDDVISQREKDSNGATAVADEPREQQDLFPELDKDNPAHKELLRAAKKYAKVKAERDALLSTSKEQADGQMQKLIALMHENKVEKFRYGGITAELIATKEKAIVKTDEDDETGEDDE